ncbi:hypothetical protein NDU88_004431 [Pleurodeles waltl]|uniref:Uncharacterized protein n=1 Tax=Pleurodeles waltl TaxID=8319 RepID=A0AAV7LLA9_PLEWA|nr:hypothetical protein NDU88_004431 [Pleurodeles waltl]
MMMRLQLLGSECQAGSGHRVNVDRATCEGQEPVSWYRGIVKWGVLVLICRSIRFWVSGGSLLSESATLEFSPCAADPSHSVRNTQPGGARRPSANPFLLMPLILTTIEEAGSSLQRHHLNL